MCLSDSATVLYGVLTKKKEIFIACWYSFRKVPHVEVSSGFDQLHAFRQIRNKR